MIRMIMTASAFALALSMSFPSGQALGGDQAALKTQKDRENYITGVSFVRSLILKGGEINLDIVIQGMKDGIRGEKLLVTEDEVLTVTAGLQDERRPKQVCTVVEYPDHRETVCSKGEAPQAPTASPTRNQEQSIAALRASSLLASAQPAASPSQAQAAVQTRLQQVSPQVNTFEELAQQQQQQMDADGPVTYELGDLSRRFAETWLKTRPHQQ